VGGGRWVGCARPVLLLLSVLPGEGSSSAVAFPSPRGNCRNPFPLSRSQGKNDQTEEVLILSLGLEIQGQLGGEESLSMLGNNTHVSSRGCV